MPGKRIRIGIVAPGRRIDREIADAAAALNTARPEDRRAELVFHKQCFLTDGHFAGSDEARADALVEMANDPDIDAIWFARGGYGANRLDPGFIDRLSSPAREKTYLGYSDAGNLLALLYRHKIGAPAHGPMPADLLRDGGEMAVSRALDFLTLGAPGTLESHTSAPGKYAAFNIMVLSHLVGTPWMPDLTGHVLMLEEIGEYHYRIDRALFTIASHPALAGLAGIRLGRCDDIPENDTDFGRDEREIVQDWCARASIPFLGKADIGHDVNNKVVVFGVR